MPTQVVPEEYAEHIEMIAGYPVAITSYRLGAVYYVRAAIALFGTGGRIAATESTSRAEAEERGREEARRAIEHK